MKSYIKTSFTAIVLALFTVTVNAATPNAEYRKKHLTGMEFGVGIPLVTPLTGYNVFVGYVNKNASTFLGRRFGIRADFTIPSALRLNGSISESDKKDIYNVNASGKVLGYKLDMSDFTDKKTTIDLAKKRKDGDGDFDFKNLDGVSGSFSLKNQSMGLLVDFYPFADTWFLGGFRFSGGYYMGDLDLNIGIDFADNVYFKYRTSTEKSGDIYKHNDWVYAQIPAGSHIGVKYHWKYKGPYAGFGFDLGIFRGFKFFLDAGVVFAHAPHISDDNIDDANFAIKSCYIVDGASCTEEDMIEVLRGVKDKPDIDAIFSSTVGYATKTILTAHKDDYETVIGLIPSEYGSFIAETVDYEKLGEDIVKYLNGDNSINWINSLVGIDNDDLADAIKTVKKEFYEGTDNAKKDIDKGWEDYQKEKRDLYKDVNKVLDDYGIIPMVKIGFMYRF